MKSVIFLLCLALSASVGAEGPPGAGIATAAVEFTKELSNVVGAQNAAQDTAKLVSSVISFAGKLGSFLGPIGAALGLIFATLNPGANKAEFDKLHKHLDRISAQISALDTKIDQVEVSLKNEHQYTRLVERRAKVRSIKQHFNRFMDYKNSITKSEFVNACSRMPPAETIDWISGELAHNDRSIGSVLSTIRNKQTLNEDGKFMVALVSQSVFLAGACLSAKYDDPSHAVPREHYRQIVIRSAEVTLTQIARKLEQESRRIDSQFFSWAKEDTMSFARQNNGRIDHRGFANKVYDLMNTKYPWMSWFVVSYNGNTYGWKRHSVRTRDRSFWDRNHDHRTIILAATSKTKNDAWERRADYCLSDGASDAVGGHDECDILTTYLSDCMKNVGYTFAGCIKFGAGARAEYAAPYGLRFKNKAVCIGRQIVMHRVDSGRCSQYSLMLVA